MIKLIKVSESGYWQTNFASIISFAFDDKEKVHEIRIWDITDTEGYIAVVCPDIKVFTAFVERYNRWLTNPFDTSIFDPSAVVIELSKEGGKEID